MIARIAVLASGGGSNLDAIVRYLRARGAQSHGQVALVVSDRAQGGALARAERFGIAHATVRTGTNPDDAALFDLLEAHTIDLVVLAGYLRLVPAAVVERWRGRILNVHPALLPAFGGAGMYGDRVHAAVLAAGVALSGPTVHFVDEVYDRGAIIAQWPVPVIAGDSPTSLAARVLRAEHLLFPRVVDAVAAGRVVLGPDHRARYVGRPDAHDPAFVLTDDLSQFPPAVDRLLVW